MNKARMIIFTWMFGICSYVVGCRGFALKPIIVFKPVTYQESLMLVGDV